MTSSRLAIWAGLALILVSGGAYASDKDRREAKAHAHGHGRANIAVEGNRLFIGLEVPGADIVGFEHSAETDTEKAAVVSAKAVLGNPANVVALPTAAGCKVTKASVELHQEGAHGEFHANIRVCLQGGGIQLLLYSVFRIGNATNNLTWRSYEVIKARPEVAWSVPLSLGDSHRGFRVLGTTRAYFEHYKFHRGRSLVLAGGRVFDDLFDTVIGADVARDLDYKTGDHIVLAHGAGRIGIQTHDDMPFTVSGVLAKTGTPVDRTLHVSLKAIEEIHLDINIAARATAANEDNRDIITAFLVVKSAGTGDRGSPSPDP